MDYFNSTEYNNAKEKQILKSFWQEGFINWESDFRQNGVAKRYKVFGLSISKT
jgi:hypothetical protein